ncbi:MULTISPECIES: 1,4-dihydroxy-2-naphthoate polyprenyltransferase [Brevibacterium]|uniref:1,4-dihydroxy-2-naphthoate octaprenyltransferase n=1 Tax=Brevibacterium casei TaxID=33889 RepID=A0A7T4DLE6_9MICO|nr:MULTISPECIES: 1,4-dihydroxy-2-naphthoate polyprenyltransferase [Brevibacterium]MCM1013545.1 1,4-dihydroxy-2-naphthoate polyprenyltransferase [Brevibacterium sp. XM4083]QQB15844.1 1,4-dihydroxy-2-naphthoate polyprenyltransferase [Brevibacterium casei]
MATAAQWISGARLRTLPLAVAPVLIGTGAAIGSVGGFTSFIIGDYSTSGPDVSLSSILFKGLLALIVSLCLQIGSNFANDYSDGIRGTDDVRVGPVRLTATGLAEPATVKRAAFLCFGIAGLVGIALVLISQAWWFLIVGAAAVAAAWFYTGGKRPYGYMGLGEVFVFIFFGLVATLGTMWMQVGTLSLSGWAGAVSMGLLASAVLMVNNLRDIPTDTEAGKITLAVRLGDQRARVAYAVLVLAPFALLALAILDGHPAAALAILALVPALSPLKTVLGGTTGAGLIPTIKSTGLTALCFAALMALGLAL